MNEPVSIIELDLDFCNEVFGVGACTATLAGAVQRKCFNTFFTCKRVSAYNPSLKTYRFMQPRPNYPKGATVFPYLVSVSGKSATVNIAGSDEQMDNLGIRGTISATFSDHPSHDRFLDKYALERVSGAAQIDEGGYLPQERGTFWTKFKARNINYAGRPMRHIEGYLDGGVFTAVSTRHFVIYEFEGPGDGNTVTIKGKDILYLADNDKAVAPLQCSGLLLTAVTEAVGQTFDLNPAGIGADYAASGYASINSELVAFTRSSDTITLTERGVSNTIAAVHEVDELFQQSFSPRKERIDLVIADLLINYANISAAFIDTTAWATEIERWAPQLDLTTDIMKPEGVSGLVGEMAALGISIWWDEVNQEIRLKVNRPPDTDIVKELSDRNNIMKIVQRDYDDKRLTDIMYRTMVIDPTKSVTDNANYQMVYNLVDVDAKSLFAFGDTKIKDVNNRWLNHGDDAMVKILSKRLLNRFNRQPVQYEITLDIDDDVALADVLSVQSRVVSDDVGAATTKLMQVIKREDLRNGHDFKLTAQSFAFDQRYGYITEDTRPDYPSSSAAEQARGAYFSDGTLLFADGTEAYKFI